jgi:hypothetical protein
MKRKTPLVRILLPIGILAPLVCLLVGCLYIPWFESPSVNNRNKTDFRPLIVDVSHTDRPIRLGVTRHQIIQLLGAPRFAALDRSVFIYDFRTTSGFWVAPLCFTAEAGGQRTHIAVFAFDEAGALERIELSSKDSSTAPSIGAMVPPQPEMEVFERYNNSGTTMGFVGFFPPGGPWRIIAPRHPTTRLSPTAAESMPIIVPLEP